MTPRQRDQEPERVLSEDDELPEGARVVERKVTIEKFDYPDDAPDERDERAPRRGRR